MNLINLTSTSINCKAKKKILNPKRANCKTTNLLKIYKKSKWKGIIINIRPKKNYFNLRIPLTKLKQLLPALK